MPSVQELLAQSRALLDKNPKTRLKNKIKPKEIVEPFDDPYQGLPYKTFLTRVLVPEGFEWKQAIVNWYAEDRWHLRDNFDAQSNWTVIIHSHSKDRQVCSAIDLCHVLGYMPVGNEHEIFLHSWKEKFNYE